MGSLGSYTHTPLVGSYFVGATLAIGTPAILSCTLFLGAVGLTSTTSSQGESDKQYNVTDFGSTSENQSSEALSKESQTVSTGERAYGYLRQSQTDEDEDETSSIQSQKKAASKAAEENGYQHVDWFKDVNESGFSFEREGFQKLTEALERQKRPIILDRIDRLGRDTLETIFVAAKIHYNYNVTIITAEHGRYELGKIDEQLDLVLNAIIAGKSVKNRVRAAWKSIKLRFNDRRNWNSWFDNVPVGYRLTGDENDESRWIEPTAHSSEVITALAHDLLETEQRSETTRRLKNAINNQTVSYSDSDDEPTLASLDSEQIQSAFAGSDYDPDELNSQQLKRLLTNPVLVGEVRYPRSADKQEQSVIEDQGLQIMEEELFNDVNRLIEKSEQTYSTDDGKNVDIETLAELGLLLLSIDAIDVVRPVCPVCNRGMVRNGEDHEHPLEDGRVAHYWICPKYNEEGKEADLQRKVPYNDEWKAINDHLDDEFTDYSDIVMLKICPPQEEE